MRSDRGIPRRRDRASGPRVFRSAVAICLTLALGACGSDGDAGDGESAAGQGLSGQNATLGTFGGEFERALEVGIVAPVESETGLAITMDSPVDYAKIQAAVEADNPPPWDVAMADPFWTARECGTLLQSVETDTSDLDPRYITDECSTPGEIYSYNLIYNNDTYADNPPDDWADFFNVDEYPGERAIWGSYGVYGMLEAALLADGVGSEELYPLDIDRALAKLDTIKDDLTYWDTLAQSEELMVSGDVDMIVATNTSGFSAEQNGADFAPVWNGAMVTWDSYGVPVGASLEGAEAISDRIASAEGQQAVEEVQPVGPTVEDLDPPLPNELFAKWNPSNPENESGQVILDPEYYVDEFDRVSERFLAWVAG